MNVVILGGAGYFGRSIIADYASSLTKEAEITIADYDYKRARKVARKLGGKISSRMLDISDARSFDKATEKADILISMAGPWYRVGSDILDGALRTGKSLIITNPGVKKIDGERAALFEGSGLRCVTGVSLFPGAIDIFRGSLRGHDPSIKSFNVKVRVDTSRYGGLSFIREYFSFLKNDNDLLPDFVPEGFFQKRAGKKSGGGAGFRVELCSTLQETLRIKPPPAPFDAVSLEIGVEPGRGSKNIVLTGPPIKKLLTAMLAVSTHAISGPGTPGVHYLADIYNDSDLEGTIDKEINKIFRY